jgi:hypothetical protein
MAHSPLRLPRTCQSVFTLLLVAALAPALPAQESVPSAAASAMAHSLLHAGLQSNGLARAEEPWHLTAVFHLHRPGAPHPIDGAFEEWFAGPDRWRRTYSSVEAGLNGTEWSAGPSQRLLARRGADSLDRIRLDMRIARPLTDPLARASLISPDAPIELKIITPGSLTLNCLSVIRPPHDETAPYPAMCFDRGNHLRLLSTLSTAFEFDKYEVFQHRAVPRSVKVLVNGTLLAEIEITALEPLPASEMHVLQPPRNSIPEPILLEPGAPAPTSLYETAAHPPLQPDGYPHRGAALALIVVERNGRARIDRGLSIAPGTDVLDSLEIAIYRWQFKPYLVDGHPADVELVARYPLDGRPFHPLFEHAGTIDASELEAYLEAGGASEGFSGGGQRPRRGRR